MSLTELLINMDYLNALFELTFTYNIELLDNVLCIFSNILSQQKDNFIIDKFPFIFRLKDIFEKFRTNAIIRKDILYIINMIIKNCDKSYQLTFVDILTEIVKYYSTNKQNEEETNMLISCLNSYTHISSEMMFLNPLPLCYNIISSSASTSFKTAVIRLLVNIYYTDNVTPQMFKEEYLTILRDCLPKEYITDLYGKSLCFNLVWLFSNICCNPTVIENIYETNIPEVIIGLNTHDEDILQEIVAFIEVALDINKDRCIVKIFSMNKVFEVIKYCVTNCQSLELILKCLSVLSKMIDFAMLSNNELYIRLLNQIATFNDEIESFVNCDNEEIATTAELITSHISSVFKNEEVEV
jgi:hypothetical protein